MQKTVAGTVVAAAALGLNAAFTSYCGEADQARPAAPAVTVATRGLSAKRVSLYEVPMVCPAVPQIGCGSMSKPLLLELERHEAVSEAWLSRSGTILAIVWSEQSTGRQRRRQLAAVLKESSVSAKELKGAQREQALKDFQSGNAWYRGGEVDRLSEEEAGILAGRWVGRVRQKIALPDQTAQALETEFAGVLRRKLTGQITRTQAREKMLKASREHLEEKDMAILMEAFKTELQLPKEGQ